MKNLYVLFFLLLASCGQDPAVRKDTVLRKTDSVIRLENLPPPPPADSVNSDQSCYHNGEITAAERNKVYPFDKAYKIRVISFDLRHDINETPVVNGKLITSKTKEIITLTELQKNELTDILFNYNYSKKTIFFEEEELGCYFPRHAILFEDKSGEIFSFIEICLQCRKIRTSLPQESIGVFCDGKYGLLRRFFEKVGITYLGN